MDESYWQEYKPSLLQATRCVWETVSDPTSFPPIAFGLNINDAGEGIEPHVLFLGDMEHFAKEDETSLEEARINHIFDRMPYERLQKLEPLFEEANRLYLDIEPEDLEDEAQWEAIHERHVNVAIDTLLTLKDEGLFSSGKEPPVLVLQKTTGLSIAEQEEFLKRLNSEDVLDRILGPEPEPIGNPMTPCGPANRSILFCCLRLSPDGTRLAMTGWDNEVQVWKLGEWDKPERVRRFRQGTGESLCWLTNQELLILLGEEIRSLNTQTGKRKLWASSKTGLKNGKDLDVDRTRQQVWVATERHVLQCFDTEGRLLQELDINGDWLRSLRVSPDGRWLCASLGQNGLTIFDVETGLVVASLDGNYGQAEFSLDSQRLTAVRRDETLPLSQPIWETETWKELPPVQLPTLYPNPGEFVSLEEARTACFHPTRPLMAVGQGYGEFQTAVKIWNTETGECLASFSDTHECIQGLAFHPDGRELFVTGEHHRGAALYRCPVP